MHERVLKGGPGDLSLRLSCITRPLRLRTVIHRPVRPTGLYIHCAPLLVGYSPTSSFDGFGRARVFYFFINIIYYYSGYDLIPNLIERLGWMWLSVFSVGDHIRVWSLPFFIILFYLADLFRILVCPKGFILWPLVSIEKVGMRSSSLWLVQCRFSFVIIFALSFND
jgi:hypothetical protein